jgi:nucleoside-diphosphate-sugar epimerase
MTRVLVTGAGGFWGVFLVNELYRVGFSVRAGLRDSASIPLFPSGVETVVADVRVGQKVKDAAVGCNAVVHLAAKVHAIYEHGANDDYETINVAGTRHVLEAAVASGARRVVFVSTVKVFGESTQGCVDETSPPNPRTPYGWSKWRAEQLVSTYAQSRRLTSVSLRLPMVYGPTTKGNLYRLIAAIDRGWFPSLPCISTVRSMLYVKNFVLAVVAALTSEILPRSMYVVTDEKPLLCDGSL